jgi:putative SOS response-associated peptidase YedK
LFEPIHSKVMPVILTEEDCGVWMRAMGRAKATQRLPSEDALRIKARGADKEDRTPP